LHWENKYIEKRGLSLFFFVSQLEKKKTQYREIHTFTSSKAIYEIQ